VRESEDAARHKKAQGYGVGYGDFIARPVLPPGVRVVFQKTEDRRQRTEVLRARSAR
jgi:hypothetical protein